MTVHARSRPLNGHDNALRERRRSFVTGRRPQARVVLALALAGAFALPGAAPAAAIKDSADRTVEVPAQVARVVPAGPPAQVLLQVLAPAKLAGLVEPFKPEHAIYVDGALAGLPQIPFLTRTAAPGDVAAVQALKPGLVVDYGNISARFVAADEKIQQELKVATLVYGGGLGEVADVATALGDALGEAPRAARVAALAREVLARVKPASDLPEAERVPVYVARGADGLLALRAGTSFDEPIRLAGGRNVVEAKGGTFKPMSVDAVVALMPKVVVFGEEEALSSPLRKALPPGTKVVLDAGEPYGVLTGPPSLNRLVGLAALAPLLHPDKVAPDAEGVLHVQAALFPPPAGIAVPAPLQVR